MFRESLVAGLLCALVASGSVFAQRTAPRAGRPARTPHVTATDAGVSIEAALWCMPSPSVSPRRCVQARASCESHANAMALPGAAPRSCAPVDSAAICYRLESVHVRSAVLPEFVCFTAAAACEQDRTRTASDPQMAGNYTVGACTPVRDLALPGPRP